MDKVFFPSLLILFLFSDVCLASTYAIQITKNNMEKKEVLCHENTYCQLDFDSQPILKIFVKITDQKARFQFWEDNYVLFHTGENVQSRRDLFQKIINSNTQSAPGFWEHQNLSLYKPTASEIKDTENSLVWRQPRHNVETITISIWKKDDTVS